MPRSILSRTTKPKYVLVQGISTESYKDQVLAALGKTVESLRLLNQEIVSMPEGWYSLRLRLDGADNSLFKNEAITLRYIAFNTAMVSGRYQISSFRIYLGN
jgi:hypothetical protein